MSRALFQRMTSGTAICAVLGTALAVPFGAWAQQNSDRGGMLSQLRISERLLTRDTTSPDALVDGTSNQAITTFDYSFSTETRTEAFTFDAGGTYRFIDGPTTDGFEGEFTSPNVRLRYQQVAASASLAVAVDAAREDLADVSALSVRNTSDEALPADLLDLEDGGIRTALGFSSRLTLRDDAPFGWELGLLVNDVSYDDLPIGSGLRDSTTTRADVTARLDITPVLQAKLGTQYSYTQTDGTSDTDRYSLIASSTLSMPNGTYSVFGRHTQGEGGGTTALSFGRSFDLPNTKTSFALGATQTSDDTLFATGSAMLEHSFGQDSAFGPVTLSAEREVAAEGNRNEEILTSLSMAGSYALSPVARLRLTAELGQAEEVATGDTMTLSEATLALNYDFSRDWRGAADVRAKYRDPSDGTATESTTFGVSLTRSFAVRH